MATVVAALSVAGLMSVGADPAEAGFQGPTALCKPVVPKVSVSDDFVYEHQTAVVTVSLSAAPCTQVHVPYTTKQGSATSGVDYVMESATLVFNPGDTLRFVDVLIVDDDLKEPTESFWVRLDDPVGAEWGDRWGKVTIFGAEPRG